MERTLVLKFKDTEGKTVNISIPEAKENLTEKEVGELMDVILAKKAAFAFKNELAAKDSAEVVEKTENEIYKVK